ncbi:unnamed protein product [Musa textilis]
MSQIKRGRKVDVSLSSKTAEEEAEEEGFRCVLRQRKGEGERDEGRGRRWVREGGPDRSEELGRATGAAPQPGMDDGEEEGGGAGGRGGGRSGRSTHRSCSSRG